MGYHRAGFEVIGVDIEPQKRYPFEFHQGDAIEFIKRHGKDFDVIAASPPCKGYTELRALHSINHPKLIKITRETIQRVDKPYIIENVKGARFELINPLMLCGTMFGLFECNPSIFFAPFSCCHNGKASGNKNYKGKPRNLENWEYLTVTGHDFKVEDARIAMGIDWMISKELSQAIPPAYTEWLGKEMRRLINESIR